MALQHLRSNTASKRPTAGAMSDGQIAVNTNATSPGLFFKDAGGSIIKVGPVHVGTTAPNSSPAAGGSTGNSLGEQWLDTSGGGYVLKIWDGSAWRSEVGEFVDAAGDTMTGALILPSGTAAAPALGVGSTDNGIYSPGTDQVAISTNGTGRLFVAANGNVGIGGSPTTATVYVNGTVLSDTITTSGALQVTRSSSTKTLISDTGSYFINDLSAGSFIPTASAVPTNGMYLPSANSVALATNGTGRLFVDASGRVGIGTSAQQYLVHAESANPRIVAVGTSSTSYSSNESRNDTGSSLVVLMRGSAATGATFGQPNANGAQLYSVSADYLSVGTFQSNPLILGTNNQERLRITSDGKVGIGTSNPGQLVQIGEGDTGIGANVHSIARIEGRAVLGGQQVATLEFNQITNAPSEFVGASIGIESSAGTRSESELVFKVSQATNTNATEAMRLSHDGRLGIGTTSPGTPLQVVGTIYGTTNIGIRTSSPASNIHCNQDDSDGSQIQFTNTTTGATASDGMSVGIDSSEQGIINVKENKPLIVSTNNTEAARIDSSGRLLVGTSSSSVANAAIFQSNSAGSDVGVVTIASNTASPANGALLGVLDFADSNHARAARIEVTRDGGTWTSGSSQPSRLVFSTTADGASSPTERMRIISTGQILLNTTNSNAIHAARSIVFTLAQNGDIAINHSTQNITGDVYARFGYNGTQIGSITQSGTTGVAYNTSSDYRLKENVTPVTDGITRLQQLKPSRFNFIADPDKTVDGFLAHEVQTIVPEAITGEKDAVDDEGNPEYQGIDQSKLVPLLTAALQEAIGEIESLKARVAALESA